MLMLTYIAKDDGVISFTIVFYFIDKNKCIAIAEM